MQTNSIAIISVHFEYVNSPIARFCQSGKSGLQDGNLPEPLDPMESALRFSKACWGCAAPARRP